MDEVLGDVLSRVGENVEHLAGLDHLAVLHNGYAVADLLDDRHFMGDDNDRDAEGFVQVLEQLQNRLGGLRIECRGSLVAEQHIRVVGQCASDCYTLFLTAGQLLGVRLRLITDADQIKQPLYFFRDLLFGKAAAAQRIRYVVGYGARGHQVEVLEDHANLLAGLPQFLCRERQHILTIYDHLAGGRPLEQIDAAHQRRFTRTGKADHTENFALVNRQRNILHRMNGSLAAHKLLRDM